MRITYTHLKLIALTTMILDHIGAILYPDALWLRIVGRLAYPIFLYMVVNSYIHTSNKVKYLNRMLILAVISIIPCYLAFDTIWSNYGLIYTINIIQLMCLEKFLDTKINIPTKILNIVIYLVLIGLLTFSGGIPVVSSFVVTAIYISQLYKSSMSKIYGSIAIIGLTAAYMSSIKFGYYQIIFFVVILMLMLFSDRLTYIKPKRWIKYSFYFIYPTHILILSMLSFYILQ